MNVDSIISGIDNPDLSECMKKWSPLLSNVVNKVSWATECSWEDAVQSVMVGIAEINAIYSVPLYKFAGRQWEREREDGNASLLVSPRINKTKRVEVWTSTKNIEPLVKGKLGSVVYREIVQQCSNLISAHYRAKNGFKFGEAVDKIVVKRSGVKVKSQVKKIRPVSRSVSFVSNEALENYSDTDYIYHQYVHELKSNISEMAVKVLEVLAVNEKSSNKEIATYLGISVKDVKKARGELADNIPFYYERGLGAGLKPICCDKLKPIYCGEVIPIYCEEPIYIEEMTWKKVS